MNKMKSNKTTEKGTPIVVPMGKYPIYTRPDSVKQGHVGRTHKDRKGYLRHQS